MISPVKVTWRDPTGGLTTVSMLVGLLFLTASHVSAHARPPALNSIQVDRRDPQHMVAQATWGAAITRDGGDTWRWLCAAALGVDARFEDPVLRIGYDGRLLAATLDGLLVSDAEGCAWNAVEGDVGRRWVIDLEVDPSDPTSLLAVATDVSAGDQLFGSVDEGRTWTPLGPAREELLLADARFAPSDSTRVYVSADVPGLPMDRTTMVLRSNDGGRTTERLPFTDLTEGERSLRIRAVDPVDADVLYAVVVHFDSIMDPHRLVRSDDGGETFSTVLLAAQIGDVVISDDGQDVWTASRTGGVYRSSDGGRTFALVHEDLPVSCLSYADGQLLACTDDRAVGFALARSDDEGVSWEPLLRLEEINEMLECATCTEVGIACPAWLPDVSFDLRFDAGLSIELEPDGGVGLPRDAGLPEECGGPPASGGGGCGCSAAGQGELGSAGLIGVVFWLAWRRRALRAFRRA